MSDDGVGDANRESVEVAGSEERGGLTVLRSIVTARWTAGRFVLKCSFESMSVGLLTLFRDMELNIATTVHSELISSRVGAELRLGIL